MPLTPLEGANAFDLQIQELKSRKFSNRKE